MKLDWGMLANHAEAINNLVYINGGGIDTINSPAVPAIFNGAIVLRFLLHRTEMGRPHKIDIHIAMADGQEVVKFNATLMTQVPPVIAGAGVLNPSILAMNINGLQLKSFGDYSVEILADDIHVKSMPFTVKKIIMPPPVNPPPA
jgi:hypothetical protein